jgi:hypothetical protein
VDGLPPSRDTFLARINARESQLDFERPWHDYLQEEGRIQSRNGTSKEDNLSPTTMIQVDIGGHPPIPLGPPPLLLSVFQFS